MGMMRIPDIRKYRRRVGAFGAIDTKRDESVLNFSTAAKCYNFDMSSGALRDGYGTEPDPAVPSVSTNYWVYRYFSNESGTKVDQYIYQTSTGHLKCFDSQTGYDLYISGTPYPPITALNYRLYGEDVLLVSCADHGLIIWNGKILQEFEESPKISSMALHYERLFVTSSYEPNRLFFSEDLDPSNWTYSSNGGGYIDFADERGELTKVVSFGNYLYVFREHGISKVAAYGDQREFVVSHLFVTAGRIFPSSIAVCGSGMIFLASDGMYFFDGYSTRRILRGLDGLIDPDDSGASAFFCGKYYLSCRMNFGDGKTVGCEAVTHTVNGLVVYDVASGEHSITRGTDITFMNVCTYLGRDFLMCRDGNTACRLVKNGSRLGTVLPKSWVGPETDFGTPEKIKSLRELYVKSSVPMTVKVTGGGKSKTVQVKSGERRVRLNFAAKRLAVSVSTESAGCNIRPPAVVYSEI